MSRLITEGDIRLFQICPAYRQFYLNDNRQRANTISLKQIYKHLVIRQMRWIFTKYLRDQQLPSFSSIKTSFSTYAIKLANKNKIETKIINEHIVNGIIAIKSIYDDIEDRNLRILSARMPITYTINNRSLRVYPEALLLDTKDDIYMVNYTSEQRDKMVVNNTITRFRLFVTANKLNHDMFIKNYSLINGNIKNYPSNILNSKQVSKDILSMITIISDGYSIPNSPQTCWSECPYKGECYY